MSVAGMRVDTIVVLHAVHEALTGVLGILQEPIRYCNGHGGVVREMHVAVGDVK